MNWDPPIEFAGDSNFLKIGATDLSNSSDCFRFVALKVRPEVKKIKGWERLWPIEGRKAPFPLGDVIELVIEAHNRNEAPFTSAFDMWIERRMEQRNTHFLLRLYIKKAVEILVEAHEVIEAEIGPLRLLRRNPHFGPKGRQLWVWAPLYESPSGTREIRRFRLSTAHEEIEEGDEHWAICAAYVATKYRSAITPSRIRVIEIGPIDGIPSIIFDGTPAEAERRYSEILLPKIRELSSGTIATPCRSCGDCKSAGSCDELISLDGALGQEDRGYRSRSISPKELEQYSKCPAQWLMDSELNLPKNNVAGDGAVRGRAVHSWLASKHSRLIACGSHDLPSPDSFPDLEGRGNLSVEEYRLAYPYLLRHIDICPLRFTGAVAVVVDQNIYGFDGKAQVVIAGKPDLIYRSGETLVLREVKTVGDQYEKTQHEAYDDHFQVAFMIALLSFGLAAHYGTVLGRVELEVLTEEKSHVWEWNLDNPVTLAVAAGDVRRATAEWHNDHTWPTRPGPHCSWCPVADWCPDRDVWQERQQLAPGS